jgi:hypothetical protein
MASHILILRLRSRSGTERRIRKTVKDRARIAVIDRKREFEFAPSFSSLMVGSRTPEQIQRDLSQAKL